MSSILAIGILLITLLATLFGISIFQAHLLTRTSLFQCGYNITTKLDEVCSEKFITRDQMINLKNQCISTNLDFFPQTFQDYFKPCLLQYDIGNEVCQSHIQFKSCLKNRASQLQFKSTAKNYVKTLKINQNLLTVSDQPLNLTSNESISDERIKNETQNVILNTKTTNQNLNFDQEQTMKCIQTVQCIQNELDKLSLNLDGVELKTANNAG